MAEEKKIIDLTDIEVMEIDGKTSKANPAKDIAEKIYPVAKTLPVVNACLDLYKTGKCDFSKEMAQEIKNLLEALETGYVMKTAILSRL